MRKLLCFHFQTKQAEEEQALLSKINSTRAEWAEEMAGREEVAREETQQVRSSLGKLEGMY